MTDEDIKYNILDLFKFMEETGKAKSHSWINEEGDLHNITSFSKSDIKDDEYLTWKILNND